MNTDSILNADQSFEDRLLHELLAIQSTMNNDTRTSRSRRRTQVLAVCALAAAVAGVVVFQALPSSVSTPSAASAAPFLRKAATTVVKAATFSDQSTAAPQPNQFVYAETEDPSGTLVKTWLSVSGTNPGLQRWTSGIKGEVPATGAIPYPACTLTQSVSTGCSLEVGFFPDMPTEPSALLAYLNQLQFVDTSAQSGALPPGWAANDLAKGLMSLMQTNYLLPTQQAALFNLMAETPGFTIIPKMEDAIGRSGVGVEWNFEGSTGALIFNPATFALLGVRTWPGSPDLSAPYDGDALIGVRVVNSIPSGPDQ
jgi:hypothetical protein